MSPRRIDFRRILPALTLPLVGLLLLPAAGAALRRVALGGPPVPSSAGPFFDPSTTRTISGALHAPGGEWEMWGHGNFTGGGLHFELLADDGGTFDLMLAPQWFLAAAGIYLEEGDRVTVSGSVVEPYGDEKPWHGQGPGHPGHGGAGGGPGHGPGPGRPPADGEVHDVLVVIRLEVGETALALRNDDGYPLWRGGPATGMPWFDPETVATYRGLVGSELGYWDPWGFGNHTGGGMHVLFDSDGGETFYAMLAPWWFLDEAGLAPIPGMRLEIRGSVLDPYWEGYADYRYLIATEIVFGDLRVVLRDDAGFPLWHGTGMPYYAPVYDPAKEIRMSAVAERSLVRRNGSDLDAGLELVVRTDGRRRLVYVAPQWHVEAIGLSITRGQSLELIGCPVRDFQGIAAFVVRAVTVDGKTWRLRDATGHPLWIRGAP